MRNGTQISVVAPWFDIMNSYQRHWIRAHRWKTPDYLSEYSLGQVPALTHVGSLIEPDDIRQKEPLSRPMTMHSHLAL